MASAPPPGGLSDEALLAGLTFGDPEAGRAFVQRFQSRVFGMALAILRDPVLAEDIAQEAFLRAWRHGSSYDPRRGSVAAWLLRITRNLAIDALRLRRAEVMDPDVLAALAPPDNRPVDEAAMISVTAASVRRALRSLPEEQAPSPHAGRLLRPDGGGDLPRRGDPAGNGQDADPARPAPSPDAVDEPGRGGVTMDCSDADTMLAELALDVLPGDQRATVLAHVEQCPTCRQLLEELTETADDLLLAGAVTEPPAGFDDRVLTSIDEASEERGSRRRADRCTPLRLPVSVAAAVAAALLAIGGVTGAVIGRSAGGGDDPGRRFRTVNLLAAGGADVGDVVTYYGRSPWYFMQLEGTLPDGTYQCVLEMADGRLVPLGRLQAVGGQGGWGDRVTVDPREVRVARLVDGRGTTVATAWLA